MRASNNGAFYVDTTVPDVSYEKNKQLVDTSGIYFVLGDLFGQDKVRGCGSQSNHPNHK